MGKFFPLLWVLWTNPLNNFLPGNHNDPLQKILAIANGNQGKISFAKESLITLKSKVDPHLPIDAITIGGLSDLFIL